MCPNMQPTPTASSQSNRARRWFLAAALIFVVMTAVIWVSYDMAVTWNPRAQFTAAQQQWQTSNITDYEMTLRVQLPFFVNSIYRLTVVDSQVTTAQSINPRAYEFDPNAPAFDVSPDEVAMFTASAWFQQADRLSSELLRLHLFTPDASHITYNPTYGYVQRFVRNTCGALLTVARECQTTYEVLEWQPLEP